MMVVMQRSDAGGGCDAGGAGIRWDLAVEQCGDKVGVW